MDQAESPDRNSEYSRSDGRSSSAGSESDDHYVRCVRPIRRRTASGRTHSCDPHKDRRSLQRQPTPSLVPTKGASSKTSDSAHEPVTRASITVSFPALNTDDSTGRSLSAALSKIARPQDAHTHEFFLVISVHNGVRSDTSPGSVWPIIKNACYSYGIGYKEYSGSEHSWYPTLEKILTNYEIDVEFIFYAHGRSICVGVSSRSDERQRAAALSGMIAHACEHREIAQEIAAHDEGIASILRALHAVKHTQHGRIITYRGIKVATAFVLCATGPAQPPPSSATMPLEAIHIDDYERVCFDIPAISRATTMTAREAEGDDEAKDLRTARKKRHDKTRERESAPPQGKSRGKATPRKARHDTWKEQQEDHEEDRLTIPPWKRSRPNAKSFSRRNDTASGSAGRSVPQVAWHGSKGSGRRLVTLTPPRPEAKAMQRPIGAYRRQVSRRDLARSDHSTALR